MNHNQPHRSPAHSRPLHSPRTSPDRQKATQGFTQREIQQLVAEMLG